MVKDLLDKYKEAIPIGALLMYIMGGVYYLIYYKIFGINIIPYLSLTEVLIEALLFITFLIIKICIIEFILCLIVIYGYHWITKEDIPDNEYFPSSLAIQLVLILIFPLLPSVFHSILAPYSLLMFIKMFYLFIDDDKNDNQSKIITIKIASIIISLILIITYSASAYSKAKDILKGEEKLTDIQLIMDDKYYSTKENSNLLFIGETNSTFFLFDKSLNNTIIINKGNVKECILIDKAYKLNNGTLIQSILMD